MRELTLEETMAVSGGEYLDWHTKNAISDFMKIALKPSKIFYGKFEFGNFEELARAFQEYFDNMPAPQPSAPQPSAPPIMWDGSGSGGGNWTWDHHVQLV